MKFPIQFLTVFVFFSPVRTEKSCKAEEQDITSQYFDDKLHGRVLRLYIIVYYYGPAAV